MKAENKTTRDQVVNFINSNDIEELAELSKSELNFHFHYFLSNSSDVKKQVARFARDTPLHMAVRRNNIPVVDLLLRKGAVFMTILNDIF